MKLYQYSLSLLLLALMSMVTSCYKDYDNSEPIEVSSEEEEFLIDGTVIGSVALNNPSSSNYSINIGDNSIDVDGEYFRLECTRISERNEIVYLMEGDNIRGLANSTFQLATNNTIDIIEFPDTDLILFEPSLGVSIDLEFGGVAIPGLNLTKSNQVLCEYLSIDSHELLTQMAKSGVGLEFEQLFLEPKAAFYFDLKQGGERVDLVNDNALLSISESEGQGLFYLNNDKRKWQLIGRIDDNSIELETTGCYVIADYRLANYITGQVSYNGVNANHSEILIREGGTAIRNTKTASNGHWSAYLPSNSSLEIEYLNPCAEIIYSAPVGINSIIEDIAVQENNLLKTDFSIVDCIGDSVDDATILLEQNGNRYLYAVQEENAILVCNEDFEILTYDIATNTKLSTLDWNSMIADDIKYLNGCTENNMGFTFLKIKDDVIVYNLEIEESSADRTVLSTNDGKFKLAFEGNSIGEFQGDEVNILLEDALFGDRGYHINCFNTEFGCGLDGLKVTHYDTSMNGQLRLHFEGEIWMQTIEGPFAGNFDVEGLIIIRN